MSEETKNNNAPYSGFWQDLGLKVICESLLLAAIGLIIYLASTQSQLSPEAVTYLEMWAEVTLACCVLPPVGAFIIILQPFGGKR